MWAINYTHYAQAGEPEYSIVQESDRSAKVWSLDGWSVKIT
jgi:hypothetical protein